MENFDQWHCYSKNLSPKSQQMNVLDVIKWEWLSRWDLFFKVSFFDPFGWPAIASVDQVR